MTIMKSSPGLPGFFISIDWGQTFANMGVDFLFSLFLNGRSGDDAYLDPVTGEDIDIPAGKTLADIDPETARFYEALGDTKVTDELHTAIGDMYTQYLEIPEGVVPETDFRGLETLNTAICLKM